MNRKPYVVVGVVSMVIVLAFILTRDQQFLMTSIPNNHDGTINRLDFNQSDIAISRYLKPPNPYQQVINPDVKFSQAHQDEVVYEIVQKERGFYIEMGAFDGMKLSNTLWLERKHKWTGLLIEANPELCHQIDKVKRSAWRLCACVSTTKNVTFIPSGTLGGAKDTIDSEHIKAVDKRRQITVPCFTLGSVLDKINVHKIDFFSLDVEGAEMFILNTIKTELTSGKIKVAVWTIEYRVYDGHTNIYDKSKENLEKLRQYFREVGGYFEHSQLDQIPRTKVIPDGHALDVVFVNKKVWCENHLKFPNGNKC